MSIGGLRIDNEFEYRVLDVIVADKSNREKLCYTRKTV